MVSVAVGGGVGADPSAAGGSSTTATVGAAGAVVRTSSLTHAAAPARSDATATTGRIPPSATVLLVHPSRNRASA